MTKETVNIIIDALDWLSKRAELDMEKSDSIYLQEYFKGCNVAYKIAIETIIKYLNEEEESEV